MLRLLLLMGRVRKNTRDEYWSTDKTIQTPIFAEIMSRDRFKQIWNTWHFSNNDDRDRLKKVSQIIGYFLPKFQEMYKPERKLSLDESITPWGGCLSLKIYNAPTIKKYGILIRMVCEAKTDLKIESQFALAEITTDSTKHHHLLRAINIDILQ